jgi:hypothetical protein
MKNILLIFFFGISAGLLAQKTGGIKPPRVTVKGKLMQTNSYCGGAKPSEEMLEQIQKPVPYANKVFYVRKGKVNSTKAEVIASFTTDVNGEFSFMITPGTYSIIQEKQLKALKSSDLQSKDHQVVDAKCMKEWWTKPYYVLEVKTESITIPEWSIHHPCFVKGDIPCMSYDGPMPP